MIEINKYIEKNYKKLSDISKTIVNQHSDDLLHIVIEDVVIRQKTDAIKSALKNNLLSYYIYRGMVFQRNTKLSKFNQLYSNKKYDLIDIEEYENDYIDEEYDILIDNDIDFILRVLNNNFSWYEVKLFRLYYLYEYEVDIKGLELSDVIKLRKMSFRKLQEKTKINYVSIHKTVENVLNRLKKIINNYE